MIIIITTTCNKLYWQGQLSAWKIGVNMRQCRKIAPIISKVVSLWGLFKETMGPISLVTIYSLSLGCYPEKLNLPLWSNLHWHNNCYYNNNNWVNNKMKNHRQTQSSVIYSISHVNQHASPIPYNGQRWKHIATLFTLWKVSYFTDLSAHENSKEERYPHPLSCTCNS